MKTSYLTISDYLSRLSGRDPVPGGGSACALAGAYGVSLARMAANLTVGKEACRDFQGRLSYIVIRLEKLSTDFLKLSDDDEEAYLPLAAALKLPHTTEEEEKKRSEVLETCLYQACLPAITIMEKSCEALQYLGELAESGNRMTLSDVSTGAQFLNTAVTGAASIVYVNAARLRDLGKAGELVDYAERLVEDGTHLSYAIYSSVEQKIKPKFPFTTRQRTDKVDFE